MDKTFVYTRLFLFLTESTVSIQTNDHFTLMFRLLQIRLVTHLIANQTKKNLVNTQKKKKKQFNNSINLLLRPLEEL